VTALASEAREWLRPWKLATLAIGLALAIVGSFYLPAPDWDVGVSLVMGAVAYLTAPWCMRSLINRQWRRLPAVLFFVWFGVDGCYSIYWYLKNPVVLEMMREANFYASLPLYGIVGGIWWYQGSLRELASELRKALGRPGLPPPRA